MKLLPCSPLAPLLVFVALAVGPVARAAEPPTVSFRAVCFDPRETETPVFFVNRGEARNPLEIDKSRLSNLQKASVREGRFVDFFTSKERKKGELPSLIVTLPADSLDNLLFVLAPAGTGYRGWVIALPPADFKAGATLLVNAAPVEVAIRLGEARPLIVQPGSSRILPVPDDVKEAMLPVQIFDRHDRSEQWRVAQSTRWPLDLRFRSYVFFYQSPKNDQLLLHGVTERMGSPETARK